MVKVMHKTGQHQQSAVLAVEPRAHRQQPRRHDHMGEMASIVNWFPAGESTRARAWRARRVGSRRIGNRQDMGAADTQPVAMPYVIRVCALS